MQTMRTNSLRFEQDGDELEEEDPALDPLSGMVEMSG